MADVFSRRVKCSGFEKKINSGENGFFFFLSSQEDYSIPRSIVDTNVSRRFYNVIKQQQYEQWTHTIPKKNKRMKNKKHQHHKQKWKRKNERMEKKEKRESMGHISYFICNIKWKIALFHLFQSPFDKMISLFIVGAVARIYTHTQNTIINQKAIFCQSSRMVRMDLIKISHMRSRAAEVFQTELNVCCAYAAVREKAKTKEREKNRK